jgi:uroporphyrin-III C-methyltransferase/precorrin-2 dehydrogenase/sirohydrochlorin ferrochelatase
MALPASGAIFDVTLTSADPEDLTLRQARLLGEADILLIDGAVPPAILARARADAAREPLREGSADGPGLTLILRWRPAPPESQA